MVLPSVLKSRGGPVKKPELLAPAGDMEKLIMAVHYGEDAVYLGGKEFGLRAAAGNFTLPEIASAVQYAREKGVKVYVTVNIFAHNRHLKGLPDYLRELGSIGVNAVLVADPGVLAVVKETVPELPVHISTQANTTNLAAAGFWAAQGAERIVLARELSLEEIRDIKAGVDVELEAFVHGAMCISYSGRCLISNFLTGRSANLGECTQPCRWRYSLVEETRPGRYFPVEQDDAGSYIFNSQDLCMIEHIPELITAGIDSFKIEGRMKSVHYVATVVRAYREAIDAYFENPRGYVMNPRWMEDILKVSHRDYTTGFFFGRPDLRGENYASDYRRYYDFIGLVRGYRPESGLAVIEQRNRFQLGDEIEITGPQTDTFSQVITAMWDEDGRPIEAAPHPQQIVLIKTDRPVAARDMLRRTKHEAVRT
ncbi:U32 family peptidase [bacterium]|nr:MAG: U32 family peptidase [bacterium]